jgi:hypothetical protein
VGVIFSRTYNYSPAMEELMRTLTYSQMVSLDSYVEGLNGELDWAVVDEELYTHFNDLERAMDVHLYWGDCLQRPKGGPRWMIASPGSILWAWVQ